MNRVNRAIALVTVAVGWLAAAKSLGQSSIPNNVPVGGLAGGEGSLRHFYIDVPASQCWLEVRTSGGSGDADLYLRRGAVATPDNHDYFSMGGTNAEYIKATNPQAGRWYICIEAWETYQGLTLLARFGCSAQVPTLISPAPTQTGLFGIVVATIPDLNTDGREDIAVAGMLEGPTQSGRLHLYSGATGAFIRTITPPQPDGQVSLFGAWVAGVPDVNGDGRGDIVVGAPGASPGTSPDNCGRAYIYSGANGGWLRTLGLPAAEAAANDFFGACVAGIPDVNGDGRGDVIVSATGADPGSAPSDAGRVYVFSGATGARLRTLASPSQVVHEYFGMTLAAVPDTNGDGRFDVLVGAPRGFPQIPGVPITVGQQATSSGRAFLYSGASGQLLRTFASPHAAAEPDGYFGFSVAGVPDANGDGRGDVLVGAFKEDPGTSPEGAGRAYLYSGASGGLIRAYGSSAPQTNAWFGLSVAGLPDVTGDGRGDVAIGCMLENAAGLEKVGRVRVFPGTAGPLFKTLASPNSQHASLFGAWITALKDTNGNGRAEIVVGAPGESPGGIAAAGRAYLLRQ